MTAPEQLASAIENLSQKQRNALVNWAGRILQNREDAEDAVQSALMKAWENRKFFRGEAAPMSYVRTSVRNHALMILRRSKPASAIDPELLSKPRPDYEAAIDNKRRLKIVLRMVPMRDKALLSLLAKGHDTAHIAADIKISVSAVKCRVHRFRKRFERVA